MSADVGVGLGTLESGRVESSTVESSRVVRRRLVTQVVLWLYLLPRNVAVLILRGYRAAISPLYGDVCRYYPSCSSYTMQAIQLRGLIVGIALGMYRIIRCNPWAGGGIDDVPPPRTQHFRVTRFGFVVASSQGKG